MELDDFRKELGKIVYEAVRRQILNAYKKCNEEKVRLTCYNEDEETHVYRFESEDYNFTLVVYNVMDVDVCCDMDIITFHTGTALIESFKELDELLKKKLGLKEKENNEEK